MTSSDLGYQLGLLSFIRPTTVASMLPRMGSVPPARMPRAAGVGLGAFLGSPANLWQKARHRKAIASVTIAEPPVFIIGHWRSGTTHMHNLLSQDPQFGCVRMFQALAPDNSLSTRRWLPSVFEKCFPAKRPMDNMTWPMDAPQEEEIPLTKMSPYSWYLQFLFPQQAEAMFGRGVLFEGVSDKAQADVRRKYLDILRIATLHEQGRRLLLKNPVNTARIPMLLDLFPDARFIVMHRSPYEVFPSTINLHNKILGLTALQHFDDDLVRENVLSIYERVMHKYLQDREAIPAENLIEVDYATLDHQPMQVVGDIYERFELGPFAEAAPRLASYLDSISGYQKNGFTVDDETAELIEKRWDFAFDAFGHERRPLGSHPLEGSQAGPQTGDGALVS